MTRKLLICIFLLAVTAQAFSQLSYLRSFQTGGSDYDYGKLLEVDDAGNVIMVGTFTGTVDFDPGPGQTLLQAVGNDDVYIQKRDPDGKLLWARRLGNAYSTTARGLALDASGNVYLTGEFADTIDFDPGPGVYQLGAHYLSATYIVKLDTAGSFVWAAGFDLIGPSATMYATDIAISKNGSLYLAAAYRDSVDMDPGPGKHVLYISPIGSQITPVLIKLDTDRNFKWARQWTYTSFPINNEGITSIATDENDDLLLSGSFLSTTDLDPGPGQFYASTAGLTDACFVKMDAEGNFLWAKNIGGSDYDYAHLTRDASGNMLLAGKFTGTVDFDPGPGTFYMSSAGGDDLFVEKLDDQGNFLWAVHFGNFNSETFTDFTTDELGNVYVSGAYRYTVDFDPGPGISNLNAPNTSGFLLKLDYGGTFVWVQDLGQYRGGNDIKLAPNGHLFSCETFSNTVNVNTGPVPVTYTAAAYDALMVEYSQESSNFSGTVFLDLNNNGVRDTGEIGMRGLTLSALPSGNYAVTNYLGAFHFYTDITGDTVRVTPPWSNWTIQPDFAVADSVQSPLQFAAFGPPAPDVCLAAVEYGPFRPGFNTEISIQVTNVGTIPLDHIPVRVILVEPAAPNYLEFVSASVAPVTQSDHFFEWNLDHLDPGKTDEILVWFRTPAVPNGTPIVISTSAVLDDDVNTFNNGTRILSNVVASVDPNDKKVTPAVASPQELDTTSLRYVIRFQNTGTYATDFVVIRDTLPSGLDLSTLKFYASSHPCTWRIYGPHILEFRFDPIHLADSTSNEPESHGFVAFTVHGKHGLALGDSILNRAGIYFDYNAPVITNNAVMKVAHTVATQEPAAFDWLEIGLNPNPASANAPIDVFMETSLQEPFQVKVLDAAGRVLQSQTVPKGEKRFMLNGLPAGSYFVQLRAGGRMGGKVLVVK